MATPTSPQFSNIARPYALAAFEAARDKEALPAWKAFLESAAETVRNAQVSSLLANPEITSGEKYELFREVLASVIDTEKDNFLRLLAQNKRLELLPQITSLFNAYYASLEKLSTVSVVTAIDIDDNFRQKLKQALTKRIQREVILNCKVDPSLIGGAIIHVGDSVIDGSIRGQLARLLQNLTD